MNKHMKIVVIGGSGFIGTKLVNSKRQTIDTDSSGPVVAGFPLGIVGSRLEFP
jgi:nucleoside-diphosphate-sugar epimerase